MRKAWGGVPVGGEGRTRGGQGWGGEGRGPVAGGGSSMAEAEGWGRELEIPLGAEL